MTGPHKGGRGSAQHLNSLAPVRRPPDKDFDTGLSEPPQPLSLGRCQFARLSLQLREQETATTDRHDVREARRRAGRPPGREARYPPARENRQVKYLLTKRLL